MANIQQQQMYQPFMPHIISPTLSDASLPSLPVFLLEENQKPSYFYNDEFTTNPLSSDDSSVYFHSRHSSTSSFDSTFSIPPDSIELVSPGETLFERPEPRNTQFMQDSMDFIKIEPATLLPQQQQVASPTSTEVSTTSSPPLTTTSPTKRKRTTRRRLTTTQKIAHNKIEKKYRTNINDKIFRLEDLITSFEDDVYSQSSDGDKKERPNKSKILERAANFIKHLKATNLKLMESNAALQSRLSQYE
ncbi:hypothetical protein D0Z03_002948 [Geotrichum reessii]|nr:hypothetical protein D0Z03_002948 [Galactomyces reessii]